MNSEIKQIDQMLSRMDNNTVAVSHEHNADLPPGIDEYFEETALSLETEDEMVHYLNSDYPEKFQETIEKFDIGNFHPDGKDHLEWIKRKRINVQRKQRRFGLR